MQPELDGELLSTPLASDFRPDPERAGAQLDGEYSFYASRRPIWALVQMRRQRSGDGDGGLRSRTGSLLSTPLVADIGPGAEGTTEGFEAGQGVCSLRLSPPDFGPGPETAVKGCAPGREVCSLRLSPPTSSLAWRRQQRGAQPDRAFAFYASRH